MPLANISQLDSVGGAVFGALPFQALGIPVANASDCWGNKYSYAVTIDLTEKDKFLIPATEGKLQIKSDNTPGNLFLDGAGYAIISHGYDGLGAVKNNYKDA